MLETDLAVFDLHGHAVAYDDRGAGPPVVLIHGLMSSHRTWSAQIQRLSHSHRVIAVDLPGHGSSGKPDGDYSLGAHAAVIRDLIDELGVGPVTLVGHSYGGGVALQFAYLFPDRVDRLVLVSSGGLGRDVNPALRAATLPGSEFVLPVLASGPVRAVGARVLELWRRAGLPPISASTSAAWDDLASLADPEARQAFLATSRAVIDLGGQRVSATGRLSALQGRPALWIWGGRDRIIPAAGAVDTVRNLAGSRIEVFDRSGHFPHLDEPERFGAVLSEFMDSTS